MKNFAKIVYICTKIRGLVGLAKMSRSKMFYVARSVEKYLQQVKPYRLDILHCRMWLDEG